MEISVKKEDLQKKSIFVATPMYGGMNHGLYAKSCLDLQALCIQYGVNIKFSFLFNESLITRARNYLVDEYLNRSDCTHLLFIDSDISFDPNAGDNIYANELNITIEGGQFGGLCGLCYGSTEISNCDVVFNNNITVNGGINEKIIIKSTLGTSNETIKLQSLLGGITTTVKNDVNTKWLCS